MTKGLQQIHFLCFAIIVKAQRANSVMIGSINEVSKKVGLTDYKTRKLINYGLKNGLIIKYKNRFIVSSYYKILSQISTHNDLKHIHLYKEGSFQELVDKNLFAIARVNFTKQLFRGNQSKTIRIIRKLATAKTSVKNYMSKKDYNLLKKSKHRVLGRDYIVSGQIHLSKLLNISQGYGSFLLKRWVELELITREIIYSSFFDSNYSSYSLRTDTPLICKGSKIYITDK